MTAPLPQIQISPAPVAYQLVLQWVPIYAFPPLIATIPPASTILQISPAPGLSGSLEASTPSTDTPDSSPNHDSADTVPPPVANPQPCIVDTSPAVDLPSDTRALRSLASTNTQWSYLSATEPVSPPTPTSGVQSSVTPPPSQSINPTHTPRLSLDAEQHDSPASPLPTLSLTDLDPWMLPPIIPSRPVSPLFDELSNSFDTQEITEAIKSLDDTWDLDVNNNDALLRRLYQDRDVPPSP